MTKNLMNADPAPPSEPEPDERETLPAPPMPGEERAPATPRRMRSERRVRDEAAMERDAALDDDVTEPSPTSTDDWMRPSSFPTMPVEAGMEGYVSAVDEIRRLYAEGEVDAALDLAATVRPPTCGFSLASIPVVMMTPEEILALPIDSRSGFFLARIDGSSSLQTLLDTAPMSEQQAMALFEELLGLGAIALMPPPAESSATG